MLRYQIIQILKITTAILLVGRGWQHLFWDAPYEYLFKPEWGFSSWFIGQLTVYFGWFYLLGLLFTFSLDTRNNRLGYTFVFHSAALLLLAHLYRADNACELPTFFLFTSQFATPLIYYLLLFTTTAIKRIMGLVKLTLSLTLGAYAWYAIGGNFGQPKIWLAGLDYYLGISPATGNIVFITLGLLELLLAIFLWIKPFQRLAFAGTLIWGILLMLASVFLFWQEHAQWTTAFRSLWELFCLVPNAGLAFALWRYVFLKKKQDAFF